MGLYLYSTASMHVAWDRVRAIMLAQEGIEATRNIRDVAFRNLTDGIHGIALLNNQWTLSESQDTTGIYTRKIAISSVDTSTKLITSTVSWPTGYGQIQDVILSSYVSFWTTHSWLDTTASHFNVGIFDNTAVTTTSDGEVRLGTTTYSDWCNPGVAMTEFDLPGSGVAQSIIAIPGELFMGTGSNASGLSFIDMSVTSSEPPTTTIVGTYDGAKTNDIFAEADYGYLAVDTNSKEIIILNIGTTPFTEIGYFDAPGNGDGNSVYVQGTRGYMTHGNTLRMFDLSSKSWSRPEIGSGVTLAGDAKSISVVGNYAYVAINSTVTQMQIIDLSNPDAMSVVGQVAISAWAGRDLSMSSDGSRVYLATDTSSLYDEFHIINTSVKTSNRPVIGSANSTGMSPAGITLVTYNRIIMVGSGGTQQYQVFDITNEQTPTNCGGLAIADTLYGVSGVNNFDGNAYAYVVTSKNSGELRVIRWGPWGGYGNGLGYPSEGTFQSRVYDTGAPSYYYTFAWSRQLAPNTTLSFQVRAGNTNNLSGLPWYGPDGTSDTYFMLESGEPFPENLQDQQYVQYKAFYTSDSVGTPVLESVRLKYE